MLAVLSAVLIPVTLGLPWLACMGGPPSEPDDLCSIFREKRSWLRERSAPVLGFGSAAFAMSVVPGLNLIAMPALVAGGTLLALQFPPARGLGGEPTPTPT